MPRTYPHSEKEKWLEELAQGKSLNQVAEDAHCDVRTIKRAIQEIRSKSAAQEALSTLYREGLRSHMNGMNMALDMILKELRLPEPYLTEIAWSQIRSPQDLSQYDREDSEVEARVSRGGDDPFSSSALLAEHLRNSKAWRAFGNWNRSVKKHRQACGRLQVKTLKVLAEKTGIKAYSEGGGKSAPLLHAENTGDLLCRTAIRYQLAKKRSSSDLEKEMLLDVENNMVFHRGTVLVEGFLDNQKASDCRTKILESLKVLEESIEAHAGDKYF